MRILGLFLLVITLISCSDESGTSVPTSITLSSNRTVVLGNGHDEAILTAVDEQGNDVTTACSFSANNESIAGSKFKTNQIGVFQIKATYREIVSNVVEIKSVDKVEVELKADKKEFLADGTDGIALKLMSNLGEDMTASATFYVGEQQMTGTFFTANAPGNYQITARYGGLPVNGAVEAVGVNTKDFVGRILAEDFTSVQCPACPRVARLLETIMKRHPEVIVAAWHSSYSGKSDPMEKKPETAELRKLFGANFLPYVLLHREMYWDENFLYFDNYPKLPGEVGIALECRLKDGQLQMTAAIKGVKAFPEARYIAILIENGIVAHQKEENGDIPSYVHDHVVREVSSVKGEVVDIPAAEVIKQTVTLPWQEIYKKEACRVLFVVMNKGGKVINVQKVKIDERVGY